MPTVRLVWAVWVLVQVRPLIARIDGQMDGWMAGWMVRASFGVPPRRRNYFGSVEPLGPGVQSFPTPHGLCPSTWSQLLASLEEAGGDGSGRRGRASQPTSSNHTSWLIGDA